MPILDNRGRLFGKLSVLDIGAGLVILLVIIGIFFLPGTSGSVAQIGSTTKAIEIDMVVRGLTSSNPSELVKTIQNTREVDIVVRNQPSGRVKIKSVSILPRTVPVPQPDGSVKAMNDPRPETNLISDLLLTLEGQAQITDSGPVLGTSKVKIAIPLHVEGPTYDLMGSVVDVRLPSN